MLNALLQFSAFLTITVTVIGWFVVSKKADLREFRKEVRELIKELKARADLVKPAAREYWLVADAKNRPLCAVTLKAEVDSLSRQLQIIKRVGLPINDMLMVAIRQHATSEPFEVKGWRKSKADPERITDLCLALEEMLAAVDYAFYDRFKPAVERKRWHLLGMVPLLALGSDQHD